MRARVAMCYRGNIEELRAGKGFSKWSVARQGLFYAKSLVMLLFLRSFLGRKMESSGKSFWAQGIVSVGLRQLRNQNPNPTRPAALSVNFSRKLRRVRSLASLGLVIGCSLALKSAYISLYHA